MMYPWRLLTSMPQGYVNTFVICFASVTSCLAALGSESDVLFGEGFSAAAPSLRQWSGKEHGPERRSERMYRPSMFLNASGGYLFFGITNTNGSVPMMVPDPEMTFNKIAITSLMIAKFQNGPLGPFDYVVFLVQSDLTYNNRTYSSATPALSWASNGAYCGPDGPLVDSCEGGIFNWTKLGNDCETLHIYDPKNPDNLIVGFERMCTRPPYMFVPSTAYLVPRPSALRLAGWMYFVPIVDGHAADGKPRIVDHVLGDIDTEEITSVALMDRVSGPRARDFVGILSPIGVGFLPPAKARLGFIYISPDQPSFPPFFPFNLFLS
eukprot:jgi/Botrbrau1/3492/Bobra.341_2s0022.1